MQNTNYGYIANLPEKPYILVTTGGGGDGEALIDWVLRAYESGADLPYPAVVVLGPFMGPESQGDFLRRAEKLAHVHAITFDANLEALMDRAVLAARMRSEELGRG